MKKIILIIIICIISSKAYAQTWDILIVSAYPRQAYTQALCSKETSPCYATLYLGPNKDNTLNHNNYIDIFIDFSSPVPILEFSRNREKLSLRPQDEDYDYLYINKGFPHTVELFNMTKIYQDTATSLRSLGVFKRRTPDVKLAIMIKEHS